jgi:hypothetical protein
LSAIVDRVRKIVLALSELMALAGDFARPTNFAVFGNGRAGGVQGSSDRKLQHVARTSGAFTTSLSRDTACAATSEFFWLPTARSLLTPVAAPVAGHNPARTYL